MQTDTPTLLEDPSDFDAFYKTRIEPVLPQLRSECRRVDGWGYAILGSAILGFGVFVGYHADTFTGVQASWLFVLCAAGVVFSVYKYAQQNDRFTSDYKSAIIKAIMDHLSPGLIYKPDDFIAAKEYKSSSLFRHRFDYFDGNDYIEGRIGNIPFHCSELHTQCDYSVNRQMTIFKGLFMNANINSRFNGGTYIWPREGNPFANSLMDQYVRLMPIPPVSGIRFSDPEFEQHFRVSTTWPDQATEILSAEMRSAMVYLRKKLGLAISFSFVAGHCYIAMPMQKDLLEPSAYDVGDKLEIQKYFLTIWVIRETIRRLPLDVLQ